MMEAYKERMVAELAELSARIKSLAAMKRTVIWQNICDDERLDMGDQLEHMILYRRALEHRVNRAMATNDG